MPNVVLPSGQTVWVEDASNIPDTQYYHRESSQEAGSRATEERNQNVYDNPADKAKAFGEGALSGLSFGGSDFLLNSEDAVNRAKYDSGYRTVGDIAGMVAPALLTGGESLLAEAASATPGAMLGRASTGIAESLGGGFAARAAGRAVEGAAYGVGGELSHVALSNDPLTVESLVSAAGSGALINVGLGAIGDGFISQGAKASARVEAAAAAEEASAKAATIFTENEGLYQDLRAGVKRMISNSENDLARSLQDLKARAGSPYESISVEPVRASEPVEAPKLSSASSPQEIADHVSQSMSDLADLRKGLQFKAGAVPGAIDNAAVKAANLDALTGLSKGQIPRAVKAATQLRDLVDTAVADAKFDAAAAAPSAAEAPLEAPLEASTGRTGAGAPVDAPIDPIQKSKLDLVEAHKQLKATLSLPTTLKGFAKAGPESLAAAEAALTPGLKGKFADLAEKLGVAPADGQVLNGIKAAATDAAKLARPGAAAAKGGTLGWFRRMARRGAVTVGIHALGLPYTAAAMLAGAVVGSAKAGVSGAMDAMLAKVGGSVGRSLIRGAPVAAKLMAEHQATTKDVRDFAKDRIRVASSQAYSAADAAYAAVKPLIAQGQIQLASAVQQTLIADRQYLMLKAPKDPGLAMVMGRSQWKPSETQAREFLEVEYTLDHPMEAIEHLVVDGRPSMIAAQTLWDRRPALMHELQARVMADPEILQSRPYAYRSALGAALKMPLDSLNSARYIAQKAAGMDAPKQLKQGSGSSSGSGPTPGTGKAGSGEPQTRVGRLTQ